MTLYHSQPPSSGAGFKPETLSRSVRASRVFRQHCSYITPQLAIALAKLIELNLSSKPLYHAFSETQQQALCSLLAFMFSAALFGRIGDIIGTHKRYWLVLCSLISTLFTLIGTIAIWLSHSNAIATNRGTPAWTNVLTLVGVGFMSSSVGVQGVQAKKLGTHFGSTSMRSLLCWLRGKG